MKQAYEEKVDFLTGCYMRDGIKPYLDKLVAEQKAYQKEFSILLLDIDHFKPFNDKYGHLDGDQVLKYFSSSLRLALSDIECTIFRFGGDEFIVVFPEKNPKQVTEIAKSIQNTLKDRPFLLSGKLFKMSFSGGIASALTDGENIDELLANADKAMYVSKKLGRGRATIYRKIWLRYALKIAGMAGIALACAAVVALAVVITKGYTFKDFKFDPGMFKLRFSRPSGSAMPQMETTKVSKIYLKSGAILKGTVVRETPAEVVLRLALDKGEGIVTLKRAGIKRIVTE